MLNPLEEEMLKALVDVLDAYRESAVKPLPSGMGM